MKIYSTLIICLLDSLLAYNDNFLKTSVWESKG